MKKQRRGPHRRSFAEPGFQGPGMHMPMSEDEEPTGPHGGGPGMHGQGMHGQGMNGPGMHGFGPPFAPPFARSFGRGGPRGGRRGPGGRRGRRGNVRAAVLALLAEKGAQHGYAIMNELAERSGGLWRPSPGSIYPVLSQLQDEGLVVVEESEGRRNFSLTEAGRGYVAEHPEEMDEPWKAADSGPARRIQSIMAGMAALAAAVEQVARHGDEAQAEQAVAVIDDARRRMYRILAGDGTEASAATATEPPAEPASAADGQE